MVCPIPQGDHKQRATNSRRINRSKSLVYLGHIDEGVGAVVQFALIHLDLSQSTIEIPPHTVCKSTATVSTRIRRHRHVSFLHDLFALWLLNRTMTESRYLSTGLSLITHKQCFLHTSPRREFPPFPPLKMKKKFPARGATICSTFNFTIFAIKFIKKNLLGASPRPILGRSIAPSQTPPIRLPYTS